MSEGAFPTWRVGGRVRLWCRKGHGDLVMAFGLDMLMRCLGDRQILIRACSSWCITEILSYTGQTHVPPPLFTDSLYVAC